jgi:NAD(P)-dependent dehydrogenase (short-subunit alcohol dehydrogenase family)
MIMWSKKSFLIIGGSSGIGLATVRELVQRGSSVTVWSRTQREELAELNVPHHAVDVTRDIGEAPLPEHLDGIGYFPGSINLMPFERIPDQTYLDDFQVNLLGAVRVLKRTLPLMARTGGGSVVMVSTVAVQTGMSYHASIAAAKGAVEGLSRALAAEYAAKRIRFNVVAPSLTDTPLAERLLNSEQKRERAAARHPLGRVGSPPDQAAAAVYLLGDESAWMTGQVLHVDGGLGTLRTS